jgi:hypothetical protein
MDEKIKYSPEDDENFEKLMSFPDIGPGTTEPQMLKPSRLEQEHHQDSSAGLDYTGTDNNAFEQLMKNAVPGSVSSSSHSMTNSFLVDGYSDSDSRMFDSIKSTIGDSSLISQMQSRINFLPSDQKKIKALEVKPVQALDPESIEYSLADEQSFSHLMYEKFGESDDEISKADVSKPVAETSHIKIIDFDKEQAKEKNLPRLGRNQLKIKYFD